MAQPRPLRPILIAGGGIGGLATAIALADRGFRSRVIEKRSAFSEAGAGIQIGPNGVRALRALGVDSALAPHVGRPDELLIFEAKRGRLLTALPLGSAMEARLGAPYWTAHRADLHAALLERAAAHELIAITAGFAVDRVEATPDGVRVLSTGGSAFTGSALIGADGLWSKVRGYVADQVDLRFAGRRAYRTVMPTETVQAAFDAASATPAGVRPPTVFQANSTGLWLSRGAHVVHYPVRAGTQTACVVILADPSPGDGWSSSVERAALTQSLAKLGLAPSVLALIGAATTWQSWSLYEAPPLARWSNGRIALTGDAAHPVLPFLAQGAILALEDALTLAGMLEKAHHDIPATFEGFSRARMKRTRRVASASKRNGAIYHLGGVTALARNLVLRTTPAPQLISQYDWLYNWTPSTT